MILPTARDERLRQLCIPLRGTLLSADAGRDLALMIAMRGLGSVAPNPLVGCVIVDREHRFVAAGAHERCGEAHAEAQALHQVTREGLEIAGGTAYVTLEPCAHQGRTPPCAPRLAQSGLARVVFGTLDPNPVVSGRGAAHIAACGVTCQLDPDWEPACRRLAEIFLHNQQYRRPFVALKAATTLDGILARYGDSRAWITGPRARAYAHFLRLHYDAIAVGRGTVLADNPTLDARDSLVPGPLPRRVVIDPQLEVLSSRLKLLQHDPAGVLWVACPSAWSDPRHAAKVREFIDLGGHCLEVAMAENGELKAEAILSALSAHGITSLMLEGGAGLYAPFLQAGLVDRLHLFQAAKLWGADGAIPFTTGAGRLSLDAASVIEISVLDDDWVVEARLQSMS